MQSIRESTQPTSATGYDLGDEILFYFERVPSSEEGRIFYAEIPSSWFEEYHYATQVPSIVITGLIYVAWDAKKIAQGFSSNVGKGGPPLLSGEAGMGNARKQHNPP